MMQRLVRRSRLRSIRRSIRVWLTGSGWMNSWCWREAESPIGIIVVSMSSYWGIRRVLKGMIKSTSVRGIVEGREYSAERVGAI
jgi:hypothetical protein